MPLTIYDDKAESLKEYEFFKEFAESISKIVEEKKQNAILVYNKFLKKVRKINLLNRTVYYSQLEVL